MKQMEIHLPPEKIHFSLLFKVENPFNPSLPVYNADLKNPVTYE